MTLVLGGAETIGIRTSFEVSSSLFELAIAFCLGLDMGALFGSVPFLVTVATLLVQKKWTYDLAIWSLLVFDKVRGVLMFRTTRIMADLAICDCLPSTLAVLAIVLVICAVVIGGGHCCSRHDL